MEMIEMKNAIPFDAYMAKKLRSNPEFEQECLNYTIEQGSTEELLILLRQLALAHGGVAAVAQKAGLNEKSLYRTLSRKGNPHFTTLQAILKALGLQMCVKPIEGGVS